MSGHRERCCPSCGVLLGSGRSTPQHRRYFAKIAAAFHHWPDRHSFIPDDAEHLRKWLQIKAGYRNVTTIEVPSEDPAIIKLAVLAAEGAIKAAKDYAFVRPHGAGIAVFTSKSIDFRSIEQRDFCKLNDAVADVIRAETGMDPEELLKEYERAA